MIFCEYDKKIKIFDEEKIKEIRSYQKLLLKFNDIIKYDFLSKEKKCEEFLNLYNFDKETFINLIDFFHFSAKDI